MDLSSQESSGELQGDSTNTKASSGNGLVNCSVTIFSSENNRVIGFISEWINAYKFMKKNQEKMYLYLILSVTSGLLLVLAIVIARLLVQKYRTVREVKFHSSTIHHAFGNENSEIDADIDLATTTAAVIPNISSMDTSTYQSSPNPATDIINFSKTRIERDNISAPRSFNRYGNSQYYFG
ncbi:hypothetical protein RUM44_012926 [Polyplax serrata]|uniref:Uncharacterized protein n=1 Tax=Polyplax serrata TaxID=468196 RepID=A0ABR1BGV8_POLSC